MKHRIQLSAVTALAIVVVLGGVAQAQQRSLTVSGTTPAGAVAMMAQMGQMGATAGAAGTNIYAGASAMTYKDGTGFKMKSVSGSASADSGMVLSGVTTRLGTTQSGANGSGISAWSSGGHSTDPVYGKSQWLNSGANAANGGVWSTVTTPTWSAVSVGAGENVNVQTNYNVSPIASGGGKG